jgi:hypothetical protein
MFKQLENPHGIHTKIQLHTLRPDLGKYNVVNFEGLLVDTTWQIRV